MTVSKSLINYLVKALWPGDRNTVVNWWRDQTPEFFFTWWTMSLTVMVTLFGKTFGSFGIMAWHMIGVA